MTTNLYAGLGRLVKTAAMLALLVGSVIAIAPATPAQATIIHTLYKFDGSGSLPNSYTFFYDNATHISVSYNTAHDDIMISILRDDNGSLVRPAEEARCNFLVFSQPGNVPIPGYLRVTLIDRATHGHSGTYKVECFVGAYPGGD